MFSERSDGNPTDIVSGTKISVVVIVFNVIGVNNIR